MFDPKAEVPSLELCQRLKELGFPQTIGGWYWTRIEAIDGSGDIWALDFAYAPFFPNSVKEIIKAPTCRELGEWLPSKIEVKVGDGLYTAELVISKVKMQKKLKNLPFNNVLDEWIEYIVKYNITLRWGEHWGKRKETC